MSPVQLAWPLLLLPAWLDPEWLITNMGNWALWGVVFIIFAECGLFAVLPGDSLLFTVGMFVALGTISYGTEVTTLVFVITMLTIAAILGNLTGYWLGRLIGPPLFKPRPGLMGKVFDPKYVRQTHEFFERYGNRALILARFVPFVRTFVTLVAGVGQMSVRKFMLYTAIGGLIWAPGVTLLGYFLGQIPFIKNNIDAALVLIVVVSLIPMGVEYLNQRRKARQAA